MDEKPSAFEQVTRERVNAANEEISSVNVMIDKVWKAIEDIRKDLENRLPPWVTWVISVQMGVIGAMSTWIFNHLK